MPLSAFVGGGDAEKTHGGVGVSWFRCFVLVLFDASWQSCLLRQCSRLFALCDHLQDLAPRRPISRQCVLIGPELQRLLHGQLSIDAPLA